MYSKRRLFGKHCNNRYVLKKPLSDKELDVILRDDAFKKTSFFRDKTFLFDTPQPPITCVMNGWTRRI